jgi:hypothetical protein
MPNCLYCKKYRNCEKGNIPYTDEEFNEPCSDRVPGIDDRGHEHEEIDISSPAWIYQDLMGRC